MFPHPCLYAGDFNCHHADWGYSTTSPDGESLVDSATKSNLALLHNPKTLEHRYQPTLGLRKQWSRAMATGQPHPGNVPYVSTPTIAD